MITFLDERDVEHGALATIKVTNAVNGERSLTGEIESGDYVLANIERGWRLRFEDEFYVVTYAKPVDDGKATHVTFDAVHQFFWDFDKSSVHEQLNDGSHTFLNYLDFIFADSGYTYTIDPLLKVYAFEKQSFGYKSRLNLFNDIITASGVEFQVNGKVVRILEKTGTDLSTVVRKNFNMNELGIEKHIGDFVTYQKGFGAWVDENDHTKGRLVTEYTSPLASVYGKLEAEPLVDERYTQADNMIAALKANVDNSYSLSIRLDMEDLTRAGYEYTQPRAGDYIMAINETLDFQEKIRIVSFTSEYDVTGQLVKHEVTCNDIGAVKKLSASYSLTKEQAQNASATVVQAVEMANKALVSADGKSTVYFGTEFPEDEPKGELHKGDSLYLTVGDTTKMYYWTGADWEELPIVNDVKAFQNQINDELKEIPDREEVETTINQKIATSKAEIKTQIDTAKSQAESNAKSYADEINQATAEVAEQANTAADALKTDLAKVKTDLTATTSTANSAKTSASEAKEQITTVANNLAKAKTDLTDSITAVDNKADAIQTDVTKAQSDIQTVASNLTKAKQDLQTSISSVDSKADGIQSNLTKAKTDLQSSIAVVDGKADTVQANLTKVKSDLQASINTVEGKIPTSVGGRNLALGTSSEWSTPYTYFHGGINHIINIAKVLTSGLKVGDTLRLRVEVKYDNIVPAEGKTAKIWMQGSGNVTGWGAGGLPAYGDGPHVISGSGETTFDVKDKIFAEHLQNDFWNWAFRIDYVTSGSVQFRLAKAEVGDLPTAWSPAPEDTASQISSLSSQIQQTADGMTLLATKTELNSAKTELQSGITTATSKADNAQATANSNAQTISTHTTQISALNTGLQAKVSQSDFDSLSGRVTTAESNLTATANQLSSQISSVSERIPTEIGGVNLFKGSRDFSGADWINNSTGVYAEDYQGVKIFKTQGKWSGRSQFFEVKSGEEYVFSAYVKSSVETDRVTFYLTHSSKEPQAQGWVGFESADSWGAVSFDLTDEYQRIAIKIKITSGGWIMPRLERFNNDAYLFFGGYKLERGNIATDYSPNPEDYDAALTQAKSEIKQTTDAITASVSSVEIKADNAQTTANSAVSKANAAQAGVNTLDSTTVKSASLTINTDGIVMKAGKSTSDIANAIGSYFSVNQNAINLFSDKINVKGSMVVDEAITSTKIASKSINTAHLNGKIITAEVIATGAITADAIKAGAVTTDKMTANSINGDRITAGTLDAAKIKAGSITASQIASGTITSSQIATGTISAGNIAAGTITGDNIKANSVDVSKISGLSAEYLKAKIENAMIDWMKGKTITAYNGNMAIDLQNGRISFKDGSNAVYRQTDDGIHTGFLHFEAGSQGGIYAAFGATSTSQGINSKSSEFAGIRCYRVSADGNSHDAKIDKIEVIGDAIQFGHGYRSDGQIGGGFIMDTAVFGNDIPYSLNRMVKSIEALWRILHDHAHNTGYRFNDTYFINALNNEYNVWHDMHNI